MQLPSKVKKAPLWLKVAAVGVCGLAFAPIALYALTGLFALGVAFVLALVGIFGGPVLAEKAANWKMLGLKNEWAKNPIPTLQRQYVEKVENLKERLDKLREFIGSVNTVESQNDAYKQRFPNNIQKIALLDQTLLKLRKLQSLKEGKYSEAKKKIEAFSVAIEEAELFWNAAKAANDATALEDADNDPMEMLKTRTSLGAVQDELNIAFAELDTALLDVGTDDMKVIEAQEVVTLPSSISSKETAKVIK